jgi:hypothetical protein
MVSTSPLPSAATGSKYRASFRAYIRRPQPRSLADNIRLLLAAETESDWHGLAVLSCFGVRGHGGDESMGDRGDGLTAHHRGVGLLGYLGLGLIAIQ